MAHRSWCAETPGHESNERLEFLGDAVLGLVIAEHVYRNYKLPEGELAKLRAWVVSAVVLADVAREKELGRALLLGKGERTQGGSDKTSILADAMEAVIGAVYIDAGRDAAEDLVLRLLQPLVLEASPEPGAEDYKTRLQELAAQMMLSIPRYETVDEGPDHAKRFFAAVEVGRQRFDGGEGRSKKLAEQAVAATAWRALTAQRLGTAPKNTGDQPSEP